MFNRYRHAYQKDQENVKKSLFNELFIVMKFQTPIPFSQVRRNFENILLAGSCH